MVDNAKVELDEKFLQKFFGLTEKIIPEGQAITLAMLRNQLDEVGELIKDTNTKLQEATKAANKYVPPSQPVSTSKDDFFTNSSSSDEEVEFNLEKKKILIIDDLGVITYQLSVLFQKMGFETVQSKEIYDAIEKFKKQNFDLVVMDLFIPTEREGFILLEELKKTAQNKQKPVKIGVMSASGRKEHKQMCKIKGAEFYVEKLDDWQKELTAMIKNLY